MSKDLELQVSGPFAFIYLFIFFLWPFSFYLTFLFRFGWQYLFQVTQNSLQISLFWFHASTLWSSPALGTLRFFWCLSGRDSLLPQSFTRQRKLLRCSEPPVSRILKNECFAFLWQPTQFAGGFVNHKYRGIEPRSGEGAFTEWGEAATTRIAPVRAGGVCAHSFWEKAF